MASSQSQQVNNTAPSGLVKPTGDNIDEAWQWNSLKDINNKRSVTCDFCNKTTNGGITRARNHQMGLRGNVGACTKIPQETKLILKENYEKKKAENNAHLFEVNEDDDEQDEVQEIHNIRAGKGAEVAAPAAKKGKSVKGPLDLLYSRAPPPGAASKSRQTSIHDKEARSRAVQYIARWFYKCSIPFNAMRDKSFKLMMGAVGNYGPNLKLPSYHELRVPLLKKELALTIEMLQPHMKAEQEKLEKLARQGPQPGAKPETGSGGSVADAKPAGSGHTGTSSEKVSTDKYRNYAVVAGTITILGALGWYLKGTAKKPEVQD